MNNNEYALRGMYKPSFFYIFLNGDFDKNYSNMSDKDMGTFVHEYVHYLQNITTLFGQNNSILFLNYIYEFRNHIATHEGISIPLVDIPIPEFIKRNKVMFDLCSGTLETYTQNYDDVKVRIGKQIKEDISIDSVFLDFYLNGELVNTLIVGSHCVKESMAYIFQRFFDETVDLPVTPYKTVEILCKIINPTLLEDKRKIISLCILALNSQNVGFVLYHLILRAKDDSKLNGAELYKKYQETTYTKVENEVLSLKALYIRTIKNFLQILNSSLYCETTHFNRISENIIYALEKKSIPLIDILYEDNMEKIKRLEEIIDFYGIPFIHSVDNSIYFPEQYGENLPAEEFVEINALRIVIERLSGTESNNVGNGCTLYGLCSSSENDITDENCFEEQWNREVECPFTIVSKLWGLKEKIQ